MSPIVLWLKNFTAYTMALHNVSKRYHLHTLYWYALSGKTHSIAPSTPFPVNTHTSLTTTKLLYSYTLTMYLLLPCTLVMNSLVFHTLTHTPYTLLLHTLFFMPYILMHLPERISTSIALSSLSDMCRRRTNRLKHLSNHPIFTPYYSSLSTCISTPH